MVEIGTGQKKIIRFIYRYKKSTYEISSVLYVFCHCMAKWLKGLVRIVCFEIITTGYLVIAIRCHLRLSCNGRRRNLYLLIELLYVSYLIFDKCYWMLVDFLSVVIWKQIKCHTFDLKYIYFTLKYRLFMFVDSSSEKLCSNFNINKFYILRLRV